MYRRFTVLIIGGYGAVGLHISRYVLEFLPQASVVLAGRSLEKAEAAASQFGNRVTAAQVDATSLASVLSALSEATIVILNTEAGSQTVARACIELRLPLVSVAASVRVIRDIAHLGPEADAAGVPLVSQVGLAPGVMNMMARKVIASVPDNARIDLVLQLSLIGDHGPEAVRWTLARAEEAGRALSLAPSLPGVGRKVIPVSFVDPQIMAAELGAKEVKSYLALKPSWTTEWVPKIAPFLSNRPGLLSTLEGWLNATASGLRLPKNTMSLTVRAYSELLTETLRLTGENQSLITGFVAARTVANMLTQSKDHKGAINMVDVLDFKELIEDLNRIGCTLEEVANC